jgi:hypothetical protein
MAGRGSTAAKHLLQNMLLIQRDCGIRHITLQAALSHGGYVWAAHGFLPGTNARWQMLAKRLAVKFAALSASFAPAEGPPSNGFCGAGSPGPPRRHGYHDTPWQHDARQTSADGRALGGRA